MADNASIASGPAASFEILKAEGDDLYRRGEYDKAIQSYDQALELRPDEPDKHCLVNRARCHLKLGDNQKALDDAESALAEDKEFPRGLYMKAQALYGMGDFETALVFYHRGHKLRPEMEEFRLGVQKAKEAIENSVGEPSTVKLENKGDLSHFQKLDEEEEQRKRGKRPQQKAYIKPSTRREEDTRKRRERKTKPQNDRTVKQLLGELYADKEYLERLLNDQDLCHQDTQTSKEVHDHVLECLEYLDTRTEFWQQQKPLYSRKRDMESRKLGKGRQMNDYIIKQLEEIDEDQADARWETSMKKCLKLDRTLHQYGDSEIQNKAEIQANLYSLMGNAQLEMGKYDAAEDYHMQDLQIGKDNGIDDARSRALDNLGRVYARRGQFDRAIDVWEEKLPMAKSPLERTWLYHEIGRCHLEKGNHEKARDYGEKSLREAEEAEDDVWQLNASVLIAQAEVKMDDLEAAHDSFERALDMAKAQGDKTAENAIKRALEDVKKKMLRGAREEEKDKWKVTVKTSDKDGAGTDSEVYIILCGKRRETGKVNLDTPGNSFEKDATDVCEIEARSVGVIQKVKLGSNGKGKYSGWHCEKVSLENVSTGDTYEYSVNKWFDKDEDDGQLERVLYADGPLPNAGEAEEKDKWTIKTYTSDKRGAGSDSNVYVIVMGDDGTSQKIALDNESNNFEQGKCDTFERESNAVGRVRKILIGHDGAGKHAGWHLEKVELQRGEEKLTFLCDRWLADDEDDKRTERELRPEASAIKDRDGDGKTQDWHVETYTTDKFGSGTDANVYVVLVGSRGRSSKLELENKGDNFEAGKCDMFEVTSDDIGTLKSLIIGHDNSSRGAGWHLNRVEVTAKPTGTKTVFPVDRWLADDEEDKKTEVELQPESAKKTDKAGAKKPPAGKKADTKTSPKGKATEKKGSKEKLAEKKEEEEKKEEDPKEEEKKEEEKPKKPKGGESGFNQFSNIKRPGAIAIKTRKTVIKKETIEVVEVKDDKKAKWTVEVKTSDKRNAGTDANVYIILVGSDSETKKMDLDDKKDNFERGKSDVFKIETDDIGPLKKIKMGHDGKGLGSGWHLEKVTVTSADDKKFEFACNRWLDDGEDDNLTERELSPK